MFVVHIDRARFVVSVCSKPCFRTKTVHAVHMNVSLFYVSYSQGMNFIFSEVYGSVNYIRSRAKLMIPEGAYVNSAIDRM